MKRFAICTFIGCCTLFGCCTAKALAPTKSVQGVDGVVIHRSVQKTGAVGFPSTTQVRPGYLIQLDYVYFNLDKDKPKKVSHKSTNTGAVVYSPIGTRFKSGQGRTGTATISFYFEAKKEGTDKITLIIDDTEYEYEFKVK